MRLVVHPATAWVGRKDRSGFGQGGDHSGMAAVASDFQVCAVVDAHIYHGQMRDPQLPLDDSVRGASDAKAAELASAAHSKGGTMRYGGMNRHEGDRRSRYASRPSNCLVHPDVADASVTNFQDQNGTAIERAVRTGHRLGPSRHIDSSESHFGSRRIAEPPSPRRSVGFCIRDFIYMTSDVLLMHDTTVKPSVFTSWTDTT